MHTLSDLQTPALVIDAGVMSANIERMAARADALGVPLRPHGKTPKAPEIGRRLCARSARGLTVSTLLEAETYLEAGIRDLFYAVPLAPAKTGRVCELMQRGANLTCLVDHIDAARAIAERARQPVVLAVEIDVDGYRTGVPAGSSEMRELARYIASERRLIFEGFMSYGGASYGCRSKEEVQRLAERHRVALLDAQALLAADGVEARMLSFGSTPAVVHARTMASMTELRCGIYAFQDLFQAAIGACSIDDIAVSVLCCVIGASQQHNRLIVDAGGLALSKDRSTATTDRDGGYGLVCDAESGALAPDLYVSNVSQELGLITTQSGAAIDFTRFPIGSRLRILPNHADMTAAAYDAYHVVEGDARIVDVWRRVNGW
jgi:D-serine deaminase-like pyridoxal phosphate-dependent protein